jgi:NAD(P)-dependent dehydrogenase (short-subunit alcohol dehydrogenase family)
MQDFSGRTAVITGGASGIGLGMARAFAGRVMCQGSRKLNVWQS